MFHKSTSNIIILALHAIKFLGLNFSLHLEGSQKLYNIANQNKSYKYLKHHCCLGAAEQLRKKLEEQGLDTLYVSTDAPYHEFEQLRYNTGEESCSL